MSISRGLTNSITTSLTTGIIAVQGEGFVPTDLTDLAAWYDASDVSTITETGGSVSQWDDKSGNDYHATQGVGAEQPVTGTRTLNGKNTIDFDGVDDGFLTGLPLSVTNNNNTVLIVYKTDAATTDQQLITSRSGASPRWAVRQFGSPILVTNNGNVTYSRVGNTDAQIAGGMRDGSNHYAIYQGNINSDTDASFPNITENATIGYSEEQGGKSYLNGTIAEIIVYSRELTVTELNQVGEYFASKWDVTWNTIYDFQLTTDMVARFDTSREETITESGGKVSQWDDLSGNGNHATQSVGSAQPTTGATINGLNAFTSLNANKLDLTTDITGGTYTVIAIADADNNASNKKFVGHPTSGGVELRLDANEELNIVRVNQAVILSSSNNGYTSLANFAFITSNGDNRIYVDGVLDGSNTTNPAYTSGIQEIFDAFSGTYGELLIFDRALTELELNEIGNYLETKWGI